MASVQANASQKSPSSASGVSNIKDRWNVKTGYSVFTGKGAKYDPYKDGRYCLELNYGILDYVEAGLYGGYTRIQMWEQVSSAGYVGYRLMHTFTVSAAIFSYSRW